MADPIEVLRTTAPHRNSVLPWRIGRRAFYIDDANGQGVANTTLKTDAAHIVAAVNAAPALLAEVARLQAALAELQARFDELHSAAREVAEVARLRDEFNPPDDGRLWVSRWQNALCDLKEAAND